MNINAIPLPEDFINTGYRAADVTAELVERLHTRFPTGLRAFIAYGTRTRLAVQTHRISGLIVLPDTFRAFTSENQTAIACVHGGCNKSDWPEMRRILLNSIERSRCHTLVEAYESYIAPPLRRLGVSRRYL